MRFIKRQEELTNLQFALLLVIPTIAILVAIIAYPLGYAFWVSFHQVSFFGGFSINYVGLENYVTILSSPDFHSSILISLRFTLESVVLSILIALGMSLTLARFPGRGLLRALIILPWAASRYATAIIFKYFLKGRMSFFTGVAQALGFDYIINLIERNTVIESLALGNAWHLAPLVCFFFLANLEAIPNSLYKLAEIDNLGPLRKFYYVTFPYLRYSIFVFTAIITVLSLKIFDFIYVQTGGGPGTASATMTYRIYVESFKNLRIGYGSAMSFLLIGLMLTLTFGYFLLVGRKIEL